MLALRRCLAAVLVLAASCAPPSATNESGGPRPSGDPNVISKEELQDPVLVGMDAMKAIRYLRPTFFRPSAPQSFSNLTAGVTQISEDYGRLRPLGDLAAMRTTFVVEVRYLNPADAQNRFGLNANGGPVIVLLNNKQ